MHKIGNLHHIAIILDGNRTWAAARGIPKILGHTEGAKNIKRIVLAALEVKTPYLTLYTLSTENLKNRSPRELKHLFSLFAKIENYLDLFESHEVRLHTIGDLSRIPKPAREKIEALTEKTKAYKKLHLTLAINYGGRDEIVRAVNKLSTEKKPVTEQLLSEHLDTVGLPDVDLMIRTGGQKRLSNFLLWQSTYAELYFTTTKWPDFSPKDFRKAVEWFFEQKRNLGK